MPFNSRLLIKLISSVSVEDVEETLRADPDFMGGFASNEYVNPSEYELSDVRILSSSEGSDGVARLQVAADLSNESFSSECNVAMDFVRVRDISDADGFSKVPVPEDAAGTDWVGRVVSVDADTRAIRAVNFAPEGPDATARDQGSDSANGNLDAELKKPGDKTIDEEDDHQVNRMAAASRTGRPTISRPVHPSALGNMHSIPDIMGLSDFARQP